MNWNEASWTHSVLFVSYVKWINFFFLNAHFGTLSSAIFFFFTQIRKSLDLDQSAFVKCESAK